MILRDFHTHTTFCDGKNTPEEMVLAAIEKGMDMLGFSMHSYAPFDPYLYKEKERLYEYKEEVARLKERYKDKIKILCGIEQDIYSESPDKDFDYVIGSVHCFKNDEYSIPLDYSPEVLKEAADKGFGGDFYSLAEWYFGEVSRIVEVTGADIIGHFDLITKFNEKTPLFDEKNPRYVAAYTKAVKELVKYNKPFEINTGAISRGWRTAPYPSLDILKCIYENGGRVILSSDSHSKDSLCLEFEACAELARSIGFEL